MIYLTIDVPVETVEAHTAGLHAIIKDALYFVSTSVKFLSKPNEIGKNFGRQAFTN